MIITPMVRNNICVTAHPVGCEHQVHAQIAYAKGHPVENGPKNTLVIGSSTGYGLASRIVAAYSAGAPTFGVFFERPGAEKRSGSAGWYNNRAFENAARRDGLAAFSINGDAFSDTVKDEVAELIRKSSKTVDMIVYSLAAPVRTDPETGITYRSVIKPIGSSFNARTLDPETRQIIDFHQDPATEEEIESTVKVMGGEDWQRWIEFLGKRGVLAPGTVTLAYSYIGPPFTGRIYRQGTIGMAKDHLERTAGVIDAMLKRSGGRAFVSVNKALVTRASAVIPVVPLYISILYKVMKSKGIHEDCIHQIVRLFRERLYANGDIPVDEEGRIRLDDLEMRPDVQAEIADSMEKISDDNLQDIADLDGYWKAFLRFHGFGIDGVDYSADVAP
ncbi:MAG: trans-2-enoyl-CoA reductase family protein [Spirochaetales bacterium]|nr:trans-2-enoyl-CoA reductase family protein [Spirochaetales bacterium]